MQVKALVVWQQDDVIAELYIVNNHERTWRGGDER